MTPLTSDAWALSDFDVRRQKLAYSKPVQVGDDSLFTALTLCVC